MVIASASEVGGVEGLLTVGLPILASLVGVMVIVGGFVGTAVASAESMPFAEYVFVGFPRLIAMPATMPIPYIAPSANKTMIIRIDTPLQKDAQGPLFFTLS
jgi:hypothetical protein